MSPTPNTNTVFCTFRGVTAGAGAGVSEGDDWVSLDKTGSQGEEEEEGEERHPSTGEELGLRMLMK